MVCILKRQLKGIMDNSDKHQTIENQSLDVPTQPKVYLDFVDILFAALIAYMIAEIPVSGYKEQSFIDLTIFFILYADITFKMFLHWWSLHIEIPIGESYLDQKATLTHYLGAIISSCFYFLSSKLFISWILVSNTGYQYLKSAFILLIIFRTLDVLINCKVVPKYTQTAKDVEGHEIKREELVIKWYKEKLPRIILQYLLQILILIMALFSSKTSLLVMMILFLFSDVIIEYQFYKGRNKYLLSQKTNFNNGVQ